MDDGADRKRSAAALFDEQAEAAERVLDVATGAGHTTGGRTEGSVDCVVTAFADRPTGATEAFDTAESDGEIETFANLKLLLRATR